MRQLQFAPDYTDTQSTRSEIFGEKYGEKYPLFTIYEMKVKSVLT